MTTSPAPSNSSHDSGDEHDGSNQASKPSASKDRECQYCHQKFTSSSLGRHLDQFLSKKKPDGIHNVDEIRRLRGGITRRTARNLQKKEQDESQSTPHSPSPQYTLPSYSELLTKTATTKEDIRFNRPHWQASGVITDPASLNAPAAVVASPSIASPPVHAVTAQKRNFSTYAADIATGTNSETVRALELSLREVLDAVRMATTKAAPPSRPFDFDLVSQTFPYLCLALLPVPPTLFQSTPFGTPTTIPLSPPGPDQYQALHKAISLKIDVWKWRSMAHAQKSNLEGSSLSEEIDSINETAQMTLESSLGHLDAAYRNFMSYNLEARHNLWSIELLRSLKAEQDKVKEATARIDRMVQEANQLQQQLDHLSMCQWPREMALWPPDRPSFDPKIQDELRKITVLQTVDGIVPEITSEDHKPHVTEQWDYERLVSKWRKHVREDRARKTGVQPNVNVYQMGSGPAPILPPGNGGGISSGHSNNHLNNSNNNNTNSMNAITNSTIEMNSPVSTSATVTSTPRISSTLSKSATEPNISSSSTTNTQTHAHNTSRPGSALAMSNSGTAAGDGSPTATSLNSNLRNGFGNGTGVGVGSGGVNEPVQQRRRIGILSDVDEYYGPRLAGLRRDR